MTSTFRILTVCTMNICRSPALEAALMDLVQECDVPDVKFEVASAGVNVNPGTPSCEISLAHVGHADWQAKSTQLSRSDLDLADLVLVAQTSHLAAVATISDVRPLTFTARSAARCASPAATVLAGSHASDDPIDRLRAWVAVMAALDGEKLPPASRLPYGPNDIPDPHVLGINLHATSGEMIRDSAAAIARGARTVVTGSPNR